MHICVHRCASTGCTLYIHTYMFVLRTQQQTTLTLLLRRLWQVWKWKPPPEWNPKKWDFSSASASASSSSSTAAAGSLWIWNTHTHMLLLPLWHLHRYWCCSSFAGHLHLPYLLVSRSFFLCVSLWLCVCAPFYAYFHVQTSGDKWNMQKLVIKTIFGDFPRFQKSQESEKLLLAANCHKLI